MKARLFIVTAGALLWGCSHPCAEPVCDASTAECREAVRSALECARGAPVEMPPVHFMSRAEYLDAIEADLEGQDPAASRASQLALAALRLAQPDASPGELAEASGEWVGAFYDPAAQDITILGNEGSFVSPTLFAHELVHAAQDRDGMFDPWRDRELSWDELLASRALIEGEAEFYSLQMNLLAQGFAPRETDWTRALEVRRQQRVEWSLEAAEPVLTSLRDFPYSHGLAFTYDRWRESGLRAWGREWLGPVIDGELAADPEERARLSRSTAAHMAFHGEWSSREESMNAEAVAQVPGWTLASADILGAWHRRVFCDHWGIGNGRCQTLSADVWSHYVPDAATPPTGEDVLVIWRLRATSADAARALLDTLRSAPAPDFVSDLQAALLERDVVLMMIVGPEPMPAVPVAWTSLQSAWDELPNTDAMRSAAVHTCGPF